MKAIPAIFLTTLLWSGIANSETLTDQRLSGGTTTVFDTSTNAFTLPAANTSLERRDNFFVGNAFFQQPWVIAPASTTARDGLGPLFTLNSCQGCHVKDGKGHPPLTKDEPFLSTLVRLSIPSDTKTAVDVLTQSGAVPEPTYGLQLQPNAIPALQGEGKPQLHYEEIRGQFKDGTPYTLQKPVLSIHDLSDGALHPQTQFSVRVAPVMIGLGLLAAVAETTLLSHADPDDLNQDGISGRVNQVWDAALQQTVIGRFGWKANQPSIAQQVAAAFNNDIGITSERFPQTHCPPKQTACLHAPNGGSPEIRNALLETVVYYASLLAVPARRDVENADVQQGQRLFKQAGCAACHLPQLKTAEKLGFPELSQQTIQPFTDLLLHDMGEGLADNRPDFLANGREWRTAPLWGIGLVEKVNGHTRFLHDGRASTIMEAILWHGGEAETARQQVLHLNANERAALLRFLNSL